jgi:hypothetical protein
VTATYVYGLVAAGTDLPDGLVGLGPSGEVRTVEHDGVAAIVGDVPVDRPLGTRDDLLAHEAVVDRVAASTTVLPMRFPAVVEDDQVVDELLVPHRDRFLRALDALDGFVQYSLKGRYVQEVLLQEIVDEEPAVADLQERIRGVSEDASYYDRVKLGEIVARAMEQRRDVDARDILDRIGPFAEQVSSTTPSQPDDVVDAAFLVARDAAEEFEREVEELGGDTHEWLRLRLLGPLAPYDFVPAED